MGSKQLKDQPISPIYFEPQKLFPNEEFRDITPDIYPGVQPYYIVSNYGRVYNTVTNKFANESETTNHLYTHLRIIDDDGLSKDKTYTVHRLMNLAFNYQEGCEELDVDHVDGVSYNNIIENFEWCTRSENTIRAIKLGLRIKNTPRGSKNHNASITEEQCHEICSLLEKGYMPTKIGNMLGVNVSVVKNIKSGNGWKHISRDYKF